MTLLREYLSQDLKRASCIDIWGREFQAVGTAGAKEGKVLVCWLWLEPMHEGERKLERTASHITSLESASNQVTGNLGE